MLWGDRAKREEEKTRRAEANRRYEGVVFFFFCDRGLIKRRRGAFRRERLGFQRQSHGMLPFPQAQRHTPRPKSKRACLMRLFCSRPEKILWEEGLSVNQGQSLRPKPKISAFPDLTDTRSQQKVFRWRRLKSVPLLSAS